MSVAKQRPEARPGPARSVVAKLKECVTSQSPDGGISKRVEFQDILIFFVVMPVIFAPCAQRVRGKVELVFCCSPDSRDEDLAPRSVPQ